MVENCTKQIAYHIIKYAYVSMASVYDDSVGNIFSVNGKNSYNEIPKTPLL